MLRGLVHCNLIRRLQEPSRQTHRRVAYGVDAVADSKEIIRCASAHDPSCHVRLVCPVTAQTAVLDALSAQIAVLDATGKIVDANLAWKQFPGADSDVQTGGGVGQNYLAVCRSAVGDGASDAQCAADGIDCVLRGVENEFDMEYPCGTPERPRWFRLIVTALDGGGAVAMHVDISGSQESMESVRRAEREARESELRLVFALAAAQIGDWSLDLRTNHSHRSLRHDQCFGYEELLPTWGYDTFLAHVDPQDCSRVDECFRNAMAGLGEYDAEFRTVWRDGSLHWLWTRGRFYCDEDGAPTRVAGIVTEITERKRIDEALIASEERFAGAFEHAPIGVAIVSITGQYLRVNHALCTLVGYTEPELLTQTFQDITHPDDIAVGRHLVQRMLAGEFVTFTLEKRYLHADGHAVTGLLNVSLVRDANGEPLYQIAQIQDISERKLAEDSAARALERLNEAQRVGKIGDWDVDLATEVIRWSPQTFAIMGVNPDDGPPHNLEANRQLYDEPYRSCVQDAVERALASGTRQNFEVAVRHADGTTVELETWAVPRADETGIITSLYGTVQDISARKRAESRLLESERRLELATSSAKMGIWDWDIRTDELTWDDATHVLYGRPADTGKITRALWYSYVNADDVQRISDVADAALAGSGAYHTEFRVSWPSGEVRYLESFATVQKEADGSPARMIGMNWDITERKRAELSSIRLSELVASSMDAIIGKDKEGIVTSWNRGAERIFGYTAAEIVGTSIMRIVPVELQDEEAKILATALRGDSVEHLETTRITHDGRTIDVSVTASPIRDANGTIVGVSKVTRDISERKKLEQQFLRAQRMESIGTLAGGIAHDLNNALAPIILSIELLQMTFTDDDSQELLATIASSARHGANMVRQVLSFARGVEGRRVDVQLRHVVHDIDKIARDTFLKHIIVTANVQPDLWSVVGDPTQLHQVMMNLCVNARDAMPDGGTLLISARNVEVDAQYAGLNPDAHVGPYVVLHVEDSGMGMTPAILEKIFDPFFTTKAIGTGTGLGLSTSVAIVKSHGGFIRVYSEPGRGTKFDVFLPASPAAGEGIDAPVAELPRGHGEMVLIVDDEPSVLHITQQTLEAFGYRALVACDGPDAIATYATRHADIAVVLTDMMMPVMDGAALVRVLRRMNPAVRVIAASGLTANESVAPAGGLGVRHFLAKPYTADALLQVLKVCLSE